MPVSPQLALCTAQTVTVEINVNVSIHNANEVSLVRKERYVDGKVIDIRRLVFKIL